MAIKFLSGLNLSNVTAGSILKLDSNGNIVAATAGTDYVTSSLWTASGSNIYYSSGNVTIGASSNSAPLHVYAYQTTDPKILIEDGNTGDASMQFKISTQQYTMGIDNSDSDKFVIAASSALGTTNALEISTTGVAQFGNDIKLSNGWTLSTASTSYAKFGSWVNIEGTGFYTTSSLYMDLDDSSSRFVIRSEGNTEEFIGDTATDTFSIPNWSFKANDITQTASGDNWSSTTTTEYNQTGIKLSRSGSGYVSAAPYKLIGSFTASVSFKTSNCTHLGIIFAASESNQDDDNYGVILRNNGGNGTEVRVQKRVNGGQSYPISAVNVTTDCDDGDWHELTVSYNGKHIVVDVDGTNYFNQAWTDTSFTSPGLVGLAIYDNTCQFNDFQVTETPSTTTFEHVNVRSTGDNGSAGLSDYGFVVTSNSTDQPTLGAESIGDGYANLNLGSNISGTRRFWHISKRRSNESHQLEYYYYNGTGFDSKFIFRTDGSFAANELDLPSGGQLDWANGDARIKEGLVSNYSLSFQTYTGSALTTKMFISSGGNIGMGTTSPSSNLHVHGAGGSGVVTQIKVSQADDGAGHPGADAILQSSGWGEAYLKLGGHKAYAGGGDFNIESSTDLALKSGGNNTRMFINSSGNIGVGTTSPSYKLDVVGDIYSSSRVVGDDGIGSRGVFKSWSVYSYSNGILIETDIDVSTANSWDNRMVMLSAYGMTYSGSEPPTTAIFQLYNYNNSQIIIPQGGISTDENLTMDVFHYDGKVYFHMEQTSNYQTWHFELQTMGYHHKILSISNLAKPSSGVTNSHTITPKTWWHSGNDGTGSGLDADTVDGLHATSFARSDADDTLSGSYTFSRTSTAPALKVSGHAGANSYNYILNGSNDGGTKAVHFVNGSTRTADGGANAYTIRNDGGKLVLGSNSYDTNIYGHGVNINAQTDELSLQIAGTERLRVDTDGTIKLSAYGAGILKTSATGIISVDTSAYVTDVDWDDISSVAGTIDINSTVQIGQGDTETIVSFQNSGTERGRFEVDSATNSYFVATGFKTTGSSTGLLKSDGTIDTSTYATSADINSFIEITDVATYLSTNNYITSSYTGFDSRYYTETEANDRFVSYENYNRGVPSAGGWYKLVKLSRGAVRIGISYTGGHMSPHTYIVEAFKDWSSTATLNVQKYGHAAYISEFRIIKEDGGGNSDYYLEAYFTSLTNSHSFECYFQEILGYRSVSEIFAVSSGNVLNATNSGSNTPIEAIAVGSNEGLYTRNLDVNGRLYLDTLDTNTTSTSALVLGSSSEIEKRTLGSNAFTSTTYAPLASPGLTGTPTAPTAAAGTNTTQIATTAFVSTAVSNLVDSAPAALDTLNELAAALGDDADFSTTVTNSIATKVSKSGDTMTGALDIELSTSSPLLNLYNTSNSSGAAIQFSDQTSQSQTGDITFRHNDGQSQGGGTSFHFTSNQQDVVLVVGDTTNKGRFIAWSNNNVNEVDYGFADDRNTGMVQTSADNVSLVAGGVRGVGVGSTAVSLKYAGTTKLATSTSGIDVTGVLDVSSRVKAGGQISVNNRTAMSVLHWSSSGSSTGAIKITLPGSHSGNWSMIVLRITAYEYNSTAHTVYYVSGHDWTSQWYNNGVTKIGNGNKDIQLAYDSNKDYVILGGTASTWSYGHVTVDVMAHPSFYSSNMDISSGWAITQTTDLSGITTQAVTNKRVLTTSDEGSGNGIDADTVDGLQASSFLRSDATDTATGALTLSNTGNHYNGHHYFDAYDANGNHYPHYQSGSNANGAVVHTRVYTNATNYKVFKIDGKNDAVSWDGDKLATETWSNSQFVNVSGDTITGVLKLNSELQFYRGSSSDYSNYIRATNYPSESYSSSTAKYWLEYGAKGGHHFVVNTDGGSGSNANDYDDFTIWQGEVDGDRLFEVSNVGKVGINDASLAGRVAIKDDMISSSSTTTDITISKTSFGSINFQGGGQEAGATNTKQQGITWQVNDYGSTNVDYGVQAAIAVSNNGSVGTQMGFFTSNTYSGGPSERMRITAGGNVGIGTTNPGGKLHLEGNFESGKALVIKGTYGTDTEYYFRTHGTNSELLSLYAAGVRVMNWRSNRVDTYQGLNILGGEITTGTSNHLVIGSSVQIGQGDEDPVIEFKYGTTSLGKIDQFGDIHAGGFKVSGTTGFLKSDGSVDTNTYVASSALSSYLPLTGGTVTGDITISSGGSGTTTQVYSAFDTLTFDNLHNTVAAGPNKIIMYDSGAWKGGFGIHSSTVAYYSGDTHKWYKTSSGPGGNTFTERMTLDGSGNLSVDGTFSASGYNNTNWDTAYGWGNHASANYLTSYTETSTIGQVLTRGNSTNNTIHIYHTDKAYTFQTDTTWGGWARTAFYFEDGSGNGFGGLGAYGGNGTTLSKYYIGSAYNSNIIEFHTDNSVIMSGDLTLPNKITHSGDTDTYIKFDANRVRIVAGNVTKFDSDTIYTGTVQSVSGAGTVSGLTLTSDDDSVDPTLTLGGSITTPVSGDWWNNGFVKVGTDGVMEVGRYMDWHVSDTGTSDYDFRLFLDSSSRMQFSGNLVVPSNIYHSGDLDTYFKFDANRIRLVAGGTTKFDSNNTYLASSTDITVRRITARDISPEADRTYNLGTDSNRWQVVYCETLDSAGQHESNLQDEEQPISQYATGTVLSWKDGKNRPCTQYADHMRMGIAVHGQDSPLIQGAEPVLCTGVVEEGDYLVTSDKEGHAVAVPRNIVKEQMLFDCVIGKALENGDGESHLVKTWINI